MKAVHGHRSTRREFLGSGLAATMSLALSPGLQRGWATAEVGRRAKACILLWLNGGPSHIDTFDPKPGAETNGPFKAIPTTVTGIQLSEHFPRLAQHAKRLAILRSLTSKEADHDRAYQFLHTGNTPQETLEFPSLGSVAAREWTGEDDGLPAFVSLNGGSAGPGFFSVEFGPCVITNLDAPIDNLVPPQTVDEQRRQRQLRALADLNQRFAQRVDRASALEHERFTAKALRLQKSPALKAFNLTEEKPETLTSYGIPAQAEGPDAGVDPGFAKGCLMARRLVENGVRFVEVTLDGWDTHSDNFTAVTALSKQLDAAFASLLTDLAERRLLDETLVVCLGEFGRTPKINADNGRDHWSDVFSMVLAGGPVRGGQVIGASDARGEQVKDRAVTVPDLYATLLAGCGIDGSKSYRTPEGRPIRLADKGTVIKELLR